MQQPKRHHLDPDEIAFRRFQTELMLAFSRVNQQVLRRCGQLLARASIADITPARANALIVLFNARRPINARELARELAITEVTVSRFLKKMEEDGWVERTPDPEDGRAMLIRPTAHARELFPELADVCNAVLDDVFGGFSRDELRDLAEAVARVQVNLDDDASD